MPADPPPTERRRFIALLCAQAVLMALWFVWTLYGFTRLAATHGDEFTALVYDRYLGALVLDHLRVVPAYLIVGAVATILLFPFVHRWPTLAGLAARTLPHRRLLRFAAGLFFADLALRLCSLGPFLGHNPGLLDGIVRKTAGFGLDEYALYRWHVLDAASVLFAAVVLRALVFYGRRWLRALRRARGGRRLAWAAPALALLPAALALRPPTPALARADTPPSVLIIATDSLRDDRLGVHGATHADITPNIDALAAGATDLRNMHVATASTLESWYTAFSGRFPPAHGVRWMYPDRARADAAAAAPGLLPRMLSARGWHTAVVSDWAGNGFQLIDQGFAHTLASEPQTFRALMLETVIWSHPIFPLYFTNPLGEWLVPGVDRITKYVRPAALTDRMLGEIDAATRAGRPFFGLVFYSTTHLPYAASYPYNLKYTDPAYRGPHRYEIEVKVHTLIHDGFAPDLPPATIAHIRDLYDGAVSEFDAHVGRLLDGLKARRLDDRTIVIITTDHGEDLYDKGSTLGHGTNFFGGDQSTHIPFLIRGPGLPKAQRVDAITRNVDLAPTLAGLLDVPPAPEWQGVDLGPLLRGEVADLNLLAFAETCYLFFPKRRMTGLTDAEKDQLVMVEGAGDTLVVDPTFDDNLILRPEKAAEVIAAKDRMVRTRRWKLIELPGRDGAIRRLYDLQNDPKQTQNLAGQGRAIERQLAELLDRYWQGDAEDARWPAALEGD